MLLHTLYTVKPLNNGNFGPPDLTVIERLSSLRDIILYCYGPVGTTELVLYRELLECLLREVPLYVHLAVLVKLSWNFTINYFGLFGERYT